MFGVYCAPPASFPIRVNRGRYIEITIEPIVTPRNAIKRRLDHCQQIGDRCIDFVFIEVGDFSKHRVHCTGLFTDSDSFG